MQRSTSVRALLAMGVAIILVLPGCATGDLEEASTRVRRAPHRARTDPGRPASSSRRTPALHAPRPAESTPRTPARPRPDQPPRVEERGIPATVTRVVDGDTIEASFRGRVVDVRLIGIDTPETVAPGQPVECFGPAASSFTTTTLDGEAVRLEFDVERLDRYGRTLAYVWTGGRLFNQALVERGFARVTTYPPNVRYVDRFVAAQQRARSADRGLWGACSNPGPGAAPTPSTSGGTGTAAGAPGCDPNYEGACIPPYPPDLDCGDVSSSGFRSEGTDPHGFDGDGDGVACE